MIYAVNYDLRAPGRDYAGLYQAIKRCGDWWHYLGSTWLIDSALSADGVWEMLAPYVEANDYVLVIGVTPVCQGWHPQEAWRSIRARAAAPAA